MVRLSSSLFAVCLGLAGLVLACSSSSSGGGAATTPCNAAPFECPSGQTCWPNSTGTGFACLNSAAGVTAGTTCVDTEGAPTCGDAQLCYQGQSSPSGVCVDYCDPSAAAHGCGSGSTCRELELEANGSLTTNVCIPTATGGEDAGGVDSSSPDSSSPDSSPDGSSSPDGAAGGDATTD